MAAHVRSWAGLTQVEQRHVESLLRKAAGAIASSDEDEQDTRTTAR